MNVVTLIGNVGQDPEIRTTNGSKKVANLSLATSRKWTDGAGNKHEATEWHRLILWNNGKGNGLASIAEKYVGKGDKIAVMGRIEYRKWNDKDGNARDSTEIVVDKLELLGNSKEKAPVPAPTKPNKTGKASKANAAAKKSEAAADFEEFPGALEDDDDDLPF